MARGTYEFVGVLGVHATSGDSWLCAETSTQRPADGFACTIFTTILQSWTSWVMLLSILHVPSCVLHYYCAFQATLTIGTAAATAAEHGRQDSCHRSYVGRPVAKFYRWRRR